MSETSFEKGFSGLIEVFGMIFFFRYKVDVIENNNDLCIIFMEKTSHFCVIFLIYLYVHVYHILMILVSSSINIKDLLCI